MSALYESIIVLKVFQEEFFLYIPSTVLLCPSLGLSFFPCSIIPLYFLLKTVNVE